MPHLVGAVAAPYRRVRRVSAGPGKRIAVVAASVRGTPRLGIAVRAVLIVDWARQLWRRNLFQRLGMPRVQPRPCPVGNEDRWHLEDNATQVASGIVAAYGPCTCIDVNPATFWPKSKT